MNLEYSNDTIEQHLNHLMVEQTQLQLDLNADKITLLEHYDIKNPRHQSLAKFMNEQNSDD